MTLNRITRSPFRDPFFWVFVVSIVVCLCLGFCLSPLSAQEKSKPAKDDTLVVRQKLLQDYQAALNTRQQQIDQAEKFIAETKDAMRVLLGRYQAFDAQPDSLIRVKKSILLETK